MSRLLFAAARGARIQYQINPTSPWEPIVSGWIPGFATKFYRIHPDDEALQYGPVSTALREMAEDTDASGLPPFNVDLLKVDFFYSDVVGCFNSTELHRSLFLLVLAEALADEGL